MLRARRAFAPPEIPNTMPSNLRFLGFTFALGCALFACKESSNGDGKPVPSASAEQPASKAAALPEAGAAPAAASGALAASASGELALSWKVVGAGTDKVTVSLAFADQTIPLGTLQAASDDGPGGVGTCAMKNHGTSSSELSCGYTPYYNSYVATLSGGALVVTMKDGVDEDPPKPLKTTEITRKPTTATSLRATGPAPKGLWGNCRPGFVQRTSDGPCLHQCLKGTECKGKDVCTLIPVKGLDGDHKVHACVPPGK